MGIGDLTWLKNKINKNDTITLDETIGLKSDAVGETATSSMFSFIKNINANAKTIITNISSLNNALTSKSAIKSVQRGVTGDQVGVSSRFINISSVNTSKSILIVNTLIASPFAQTDRLSQLARTSGVIQLYSSTQIKQESTYQVVEWGIASTILVGIDWQVIEFV